jgi:hypothetical protein
MDKKEFCEEVEEILIELQPEKELIKKVLREVDSQYTFSAYRYKYEKGQEAYKRTIRFRKAKNLIEYLLDLLENRK